MGLKDYSPCDLRSFTMLTLQEFKKLARKGNLIPIFEEFSADLETPLSVFLKIKTGTYDFLLESVQGGEQWGRYSFLGSNPKTVIKTREGELFIKEGKKWSQGLVDGDPLKSLENILARYKPVAYEGLPKFFGGAVGFISYDAVRFFERMPNSAKDELKLPDTTFLITDTLVVFDNLKQTIKLVACVFLDEKKSNLQKKYKEAVAKINKLKSQIQKPLSPQLIKEVYQRKTSSKDLGLAGLKAIHSEKEFCALVDQAKEYIKAGDIFQIQVSTRFQTKTKARPFDLYRAIRKLNPSPYMYYLTLDDMSIVGASPEIMVRLADGGKVEVRPIAGTRRRGYTPEEDAALEVELKNDPKERAEHIMLVDLGRNDVGRVSEAASVVVDDLMTIERYSHVMHLVSHVSGKLKKDKTPFDVIRATFPAGTLTGAPKIRAMEIIEELEGRRRGIYGGAVGYIGFNGLLDMAITIRTALFHGGNIYIQAAAGIVYDSVPKYEYKECQNKARGMMKALESLK